MGTLGNLFEILRDNSFQEIEDEASQEVAIALAGNTADVRDKLHRALSTRLESLWTPSPFRLIETHARPEIGADDDDSGGVLLYTLYQGDRIPSEKRAWLSELAATERVSVIVVALDRRSEEAFRNPGTGKGLRAINPLRLVGGREVTGPSGSQPSADGAAFNQAGVRATWSEDWKNDLDQLAEESGQKLAVIYLNGLDLDQLQARLLPAIVDRLEKRALALARRAPIFRNTVASYLIAKTARSNAELVLLANLTSGLPFISAIFDSGADFVVLTKNQFELSHRLAGVYGQKRDSRVEVYLEIAPIIGAAFAWKTLSSMAAKKVPALVGMLPKAVIAYAATVIVGRIAQAYYASGRQAPAQLSQAVRNVLAQLGLIKKNGNNQPEDNDSPRRIRFS
ncbi:MAG: hypothetical protein JWP00_3124 [Chloroflexi bacterium]|jgi:uncharacterized protein (DUF697 family)|nr:hypothetical protein [Chloroflexota bacterium]